MLTPVQMSTLFLQEEAPGFFPPYLISLLTPSSSEEEASKLIDEAIRNAWLPKQSSYELDDFIRICEELRKKEGRIRVIGLTGITQARCYRTLQGIAKTTKTPTL
jgi:hypothetical protein